MTKERSTKIVNFIPPGAWVLALGLGLIVEMQYVLTSSCLHWGMDETNQVYSNNDQRGATKIIKP